MSYQKTRELVAACYQIDVAHLHHWNTNNNIGIIGADNCAYYNAQQYVRNNQQSKFINTINWYYKFDDRPINTEYHSEDEPLQEESEEITDIFW